MNNYEANIRNYLALNLSLLSPDYELIAMEHYIPGSLATKSFIDILAKDQDNNYIVIEVKRSDQAARQAIHEIYKYVEAVKNHYKVNVSEIKALLVSTEWDELFIPFSAFSNSTEISVEGFQIKIDTDFKILSVAKVKTCKTNKGRLFSPVQKCYLFYNEENLEKGIKNHHEQYKLKGFQDYVLVILKAPERDESLFKNAMAEMVAKIMGSKPNYEDYHKMQMSRYMIYSAFQRLSTQEYQEILKGNPDLHEETNYIINEFSITDTERIDEILEENILGSLEPYFYFDESERGYPAKFAHKILEDEKWQILEIIRSSSLARNTLLADDKILFEMQGRTGISNALLNDAFTIGHKAKFSEMKENAMKALKYNDIWRNHLKIFFDEIEPLEGYKFEIEIFNPGYILLTIIQIIVSENLKENLPNYIIRVSKNNHERIFAGAFKWNGKAPDLSAIINNYYNGNPGDLILTLFSIGFDGKNESILNELGLTYESYVVDNSSGERQFFIFSNFRLEKTQSIQNGLTSFMQVNSEFVNELVALYRHHYFELKN